MTYLNDDIRKNPKITLTILLLLIIYIIYEIYRVPQDINLTYDTEITCGFFIKTKTRYQNRGVYQYYADIQTKKYGLVSHLVNSDFTDSMSQTDFKKLAPNTKIYLKVQKPKDNNWLNRKFRFQIIKMKIKKLKGLIHMKAFYTH